MDFLLNCWHQRPKDQVSPTKTSFRSKNETWIFCGKKQRFILHESLMELSQIKASSFRFSIYLSTIHPSTLYIFILFVFLFTSIFRWSFFLFSFFFSPMALIMKSGAGVVNLSVWSNREQKKQMINFTLWWIQQHHYIFFRKNCLLKDVARLENPTTQLISLLE